MPSGLERDQSLGVIQIHPFSDVLNVKCWADYIMRLRPGLSWAGGGGGEAELTFKKDRGARQKFEKNSKGVPRSSFVGLAKATH